MANTDHKSGYKKRQMRVLSGNPGPRQMYVPFGSPGAARQASIKEIEEYKASLAKMEAELGIDGN